MDEPQCIKYDMCHVVKNRIRRKNTQRAYCIREEGYECAFFLPKIKSAFDKFTNMSCDGCEAEDCASACQTWINEHDAAIARKAREDVLKIIEGCISAEGFLCVDQDDPVVLVPDLNRCIGAIRRSTPRTEQEQPR